MLVYIGTYTQTTSRGIYGMRFDSDQGTLSSPVLAAEAQNPTFLALGPDGRTIYSVGEVKTSPPAKSPTGCVNAFALDSSSGALKPIDQQPTGSGSTTHVGVDATGRMAAVVSYSGNYLCTLPIKEGGALGAPALTLRDEGALGPNKERQAMPHPHSITFSPDNRFAVVCDLALDRVFVYKIDPDRAALSAAEPDFASAPPGAGPRHSKFSADGRFLYVVCEMGGIVCVYSFAPDTGALKLVQTISTLPPDFDGIVNSAEVRIHPNGRFVYASNRDISGKGRDSIAVFARDPDRGTLTLVQIVPSGGHHPRNFALAPDGRWMLCANRDTNDIVVFRVDPETGRIAPTGAKAEVPMPVCVLFVP
jgi:6-phosphogluconolactonase